MRKMPFDIPTMPEQVEPAWLTAVLRHSGMLKQATVRSVQMTRFAEEASYVGQIARFELSYDYNEPGAPASLVGKFSSTHPAVRLQLKKDFTREIGFYRHLAPGTSLPAPRCYYNDIDLHTGYGVLLLEDLGHLYAADLLGGCQANEIEVVVHQLATIHGRWWNRPQLQTMDWLPSVEDYVNKPFGDWWQQYPKAVARLLPDFPLPPAVRQAGQYLHDRMAAILAQLAKPPFTCIHRDPHVDNILFDQGQDDPACQIYDWAYVAWGRGVTDVTYFLISSVQPGRRRRLEKALLNTYHHRLLELGVNDYSLDQCRHDYRLSAVLKLFITVMATVLLDNDTPWRRRWRTADLRRLNAFIEDHGVNELLAFL